jgi:hypothetical protein
VYRVEGVEPVDRFETYRGINRVYYPAEERNPRVVGPNEVANGDFEEGLSGWWTWSGDEGTQSSVVETADGRAAKLVTRSGEAYPIAQKFAVRPGYPYRLAVEAEGSGVATLYWYDGAKSAENLTKLERYPLDDLPTTVIAEGDLLSIRILPQSPRLVIDEVAVSRTLYPRRTGFGPNAGNIPGVVVDGREFDRDLGGVVAVNVRPRTAARIDADVRIVDAETVLGGTLVFDDRFRQGVAVELPDGGDGRLPASIPENATVVTYETDAGTVVDYWRVGEFDDTPVTVLHTSYDERWVGPPGSVHFEAKGWANGFANASPEEIRWTGDVGRDAVVKAWLAAWGIALLALVAVPSYRRLRERSSR